MIEIKITLDDTGGVAVNGFPNDQIITFGLLEIARQSVQQYYKDQQNKIQPATFDLSALKRQHD